jgi:lipid-A-disaccharide synthase-like uncharacterized protein
MLKEDWWVYVIGFGAQLLFSARLLIQWIASERAKKVLSPTLFWQLSLLGSFLLFLYGWLKNDFAIAAGQFVAYFIYIWNLKQKQAWRPMPAAIRLGIYLMPFITILYFCFDLQTAVENLFRNEDIPLALLLFGTFGQITFTLRFVYQWWYSKREGESLLPLPFWIISLVGSSMIITYAAIRLDVVLLVGQTPGAIVYLRNIMIAAKEKK